MSKLPTFLAISALSLGIVGCAQRDFVVLKNPVTGQIVTCNVNSGASFFPLVQTAADNSATQRCAAGYQAAGFLRLE